MTCRLIINADDFGDSDSVNEAIGHLYDSGVVSSTSLLAGGSAAEQAVEFARGRPGLSVGLHLALTHSAPVLPPEKLPLLVDAKGRFSDNCLHTALKVTTWP